MAEGIRRLLQAQGGAGSGRELTQAGFSRRTVEAMVRRHDLVRVRRDAVVLASALAGSTPWGKEALRVRAVGRSMAPAPSTTGSAGDHPVPYALSHESALMMHGLPYFGEDGAIHLVRTDGRRGRRNGIVWVHRPVAARWVTQVDGLRVVTPTMAALQVAATHGAEAGLVALDGVLHRAQQRDKDAVGRGEGPAVAEVRRQINSALEDGFGSATPVVRLVAELADGRSESAGESRSRWLVRILGLGPCHPQFEVKDGDTLVGVADLKLERWDVVVEFDGAGKYTDPDVLLAEKDREDRIRARGYEVVRIRWADLARPNLLRRRLLEAIARAEARTASTG